MSRAYLVKSVPVFLVVGLAESLEQEREKLFSLAVELSIQSTDHLEKQFAASQHTRVVLSDDLKHREQEAVLVLQISDEKGKALDGEINDVIRLVLLAEQGNDLVNDDRDVLAEERF